MKSFLLLLLIITGFTASATTYYFSASGSDANNGTSASTPWQTIAKFNAVFASKAPGDNFLFNKGDVFYGALVVSRSGSAGNPITIGAYGSGATPVITGFTTINAWTNLGSNIWESTSAVSSLPALNMVVINGTNMQMGRTPNKGYFTIDTSQGLTSITSSSLNSAVTNWTGAEVVIRKVAWITDRSPVTSQTGSTLNYTSGSTYDAATGWGFFIQNDTRTLDTANEWYYNPSTKKLRIYSTSSPMNVKVTTKDTLVKIQSKSYITFDGLSFDGSNTFAFTITADHVTIQNCNIDHSGMEAVWGALNISPSGNFVFQNNTINHTNNNALNIRDNFKGALIQNNVIKNTGVQEGMMTKIVNGNQMGIGIQVRADDVLVQYNEIDSSGFVGIEIFNNNDIVQYNLVNYCLLTIADGGGIYQWVGNGNSPKTGQKILHNIVLNAIGNNAGTLFVAGDLTQAEGIYADDLTGNMEIAYNTSAFCGYAGILLHNTTNMNVHDNTLYNNGTSVLFVSSNPTNPIRTTTFKNNIIVAKLATQKVAYFDSRISDISSFGSPSAIDSNYWARPMDDNSVFKTLQGTTSGAFSLSVWKTSFGYDAHSSKSPKTITNANDLRFEYNASQVNKTVSLDGNYIDVKNVSYNGTITLAPYASAVLIRNGAITNQSPTAKAGSDQTITLPTSTVSFSGSGTDPDGSIATYGWTKISGPVPGTITNATSAATPVTALVQGVYQFQLKVTDNNSATNADTIQVTVNAGNIPPTGNAGANQSITLPANTVILSGSGTDPDGNISSYSWTKISGPAAGAITNVSSASTTVTSLTEGVYQFQLKVTDDDSATDVEIVQITVNAANIPPTGNAGANQSITLPANTISLSGSGTDPDGSISSYGWTKVSGPSSGTITNVNSASTTVTALTEGVYQFQLKVTDDDLATDVEIVQITVNAANMPPTANAGTNQVITLPISSVSFSGSGTDADGSVSSYSWTKMSGPASGTITDATSSATTVTALVQGVYQFQLKVTDNSGDSAISPVQIIVTPANISPIANSGADQSIKLPINTVSLNGNGTDADGTISTYSWTKISGPVAGTITSAASAATTITALAQGVYKFQLKVTDNNAATAVDTIQVTVAAANILPKANAGIDQSLKLPASTASMTGIGTDTDGTISAYSWTKISGPAAGTITSAASAATTITALAQGVYKFQLKVTDNNAATAVDTIQVTVAAANILPKANAGIDQSLKLPVSTASMTGSGTDTDGTISAYSWTKISGPAAGTITSAASAATTITALAQGVYKFQLKVTDNNAATAVDTIQVTVAAANILPKANAGIDQSIKLPASTASVTGGGIDTDGTISAYSWTKISGPAAGTITSAASVATTITALAQGVYQFQLKVTDNNAATALDTIQVTVAAANILPTANAGTDQSITLPINTASITGSGTDIDGTISAYSWTEISGPSAGTITNAASSASSVTGLVQGSYQFELKVTDNNAATAVDTVQVTVNAANILPTANAGTDQAITLPVNTISLTGSGTDIDGNISAYSWTEISGPSAGTITNAASSSGSVTGLVQGIYQFELKITDNSSATTTDTVQVTVNAANILPTANAGTDQAITLPVNTISLTGSGTDIDGSISAYSWTEISGPSAGTITNAASSSGSVTGLVQGSYQFELNVTDNNGASGLDTIQVTVNAANILPTANAGIDQAITLPINTASLTGSGTDIDGSISTYSWTEISGPSAGTVTNAASSASSVSELMQGIYQFELNVTDNNGASGLDTIQVTVNAANILPTANAGADQAITLPINIASLTGSGTDIDGSISTYSWTEISGPSAGTITNAASSSSSITGLVQGIYQFELNVTDNNGASGLDTIQLTVNAANILPAANAGADQAITLPINTVLLTGSGTDTDGSISTYSWTEISGPSAGTITNAASSATSITGLIQGIYQFELKITDNSLATAVDTIQVTVAAANILPKANAGIDQSIKLPTSTVSMTGSGTDTDGTISAYSWTKISGPAAGTITSAASAATTITALAQGVYKFQLKVTDNNAATAVDTIQVTVAAANILPKANAGIDQSLKLPASTASMTGSGTDTDGTVSAYSWTKISGPAAGTITSAASAATTITALAQGVYKFQLKVTDNNAATAVDTIQVTVAAANILPKANAGIDQSIKLPTSTASMTGIGTDTDGTISAYSWTKISGPAAGTITSAASASTTITALAQGVYKFQLKVTDNNAATAVDTIQVTVAAANILPKANAGIDQSIKLPASTASMTGSGTDTDGTISAYSWTKISGPAAGTITSAASAATTITALAQGVYKFQLKVTDNNAATAVDTIQVTVAAANILPKANAGIDQSLKLPTSTASMTGSGTDTDGTISAYSWTKISGPAAGTITSAASAATTITALAQGVYKFQLKVTDNNAATALDTIQVTVAAANILPKANAGFDQSIKLPTSTASMTGIGTDTDGTISAYSWTKISGPVAGTITSAASAATTITALAQGVYKFQLKVTDNNAATAVDTIQVTVAAANILPKANAGIDQSIKLPVSTASMTGSGTDTDGTISAYSWTKISGPVAGTITSAASAATTITALAQGVYKFQLKVTDNNAATGVDTIQVTVAAANILPKANAGIDQSLKLPASTASMTGIGTDTDGTISAYSWTKISGPAAGTITSAASAATTITALAQGVYKFQLKVTDNNAATAVDTIQVTVAAANILPKANAGIDQSVKLPASTASMTGSGTDTDGTISAYSWTKISGPAAGTITSAASAATTITALAQGVYKFQLKVTDNNAATAVDTIQVTVAAANILPKANAGIDQSIKLPVSTASMTGGGTDTDGTISAYSWTKISGPAAGTITSAASVATTITALAQGVYQFQLKVTDNNAATAVDTIQVTVDAANIPPAANAGADKTITLPVSIISLAGSGADQDGTIVNYNWTKLSGPALENIVNPLSPVTDVSGLLGGVYQFEFRVTDNNGATASDTIQITVDTVANMARVADDSYAKISVNKNVVYQNFPNPFTSITTIRYEVADKAPVKIIVLNTLGIQVAVLANEIKQPGNYQVQWNAGNLASGNYYYTVIIGDNATTKKMLKIN